MDHLKNPLPDAGSQLVKACQTMTLIFSVRINYIEYEVHLETWELIICTEKERKIRHVKESFSNSINNDRL